MAKLTFGDNSGTPAIFTVQEVPKTKYGATIDSFLEDVDADGNLKKATWSGVLDFSSVKHIGEKALRYMFYEHSGITGVNFSLLESVANSGLAYAFYNCSKINTLDLGSLKTIADYGLQNTFYGCNRLAGDLDLSSLETVGSYGMAYAFCAHGLQNVDLSSLRTIAERGFNYAFYGHASITSIDFSSLETIGASAFATAFYGCSKLTKLSFPALTSVQTSSFGAQMITSCSSLKEIHFRADMQTAIEACTGYSSKFGATTSGVTIYFDL